MRVTHVFLEVDISHAFAVELLLQVGDGSIVPWDPVDPCVLKTSFLYHLTAQLHDHWNKLHNIQQENIR